MKHRAEKPLGGMDPPNVDYEHWLKKEAARKTDINRKAKPPHHMKEDDGPVVRGPHGNVIPKSMQDKFDEIQRKMAEAKAKTQEALGNMGELPTDTEAGESQPKQDQAQEKEAVEAQPEKDKTAESKSDDPWDFHKAGVALSEAGEGEDEEITPGIEKTMDVFKNLMEKGAHAMHSHNKRYIAPAFRAVKQYLEKESEKKAGHAPEKATKSSTREEATGYPKIEKPEDLNPFTKWIENEKHKKELEAAASEEREKAKHEAQAYAEPPKVSQKKQGPFEEPLRPIQKQWNQEQMKHRADKPLGGMDPPNVDYQHWLKKEAARKTDINRKARPPPRMKEEDGPVVRGPHGNVIPKSMQDKFDEIQKKMDEAKRKTQEALGEMGVDTKEEAAAEPQSNQDQPEESQSKQDQPEESKALQPKPADDPWDFHKTGVALAEDPVKKWIEEQAKKQQPVAASPKLPPQDQSANQVLSTLGKWFEEQAKKSAAVQPHQPQQDAARLSLEAQKPTIKEGASTQNSPLPTTLFKEVMDKDAPFWQAVMGSVS